MHNKKGTVHMDLKCVGMYFTHSDEENVKQYC
jgi:hypothetical protein